MSGLKDWKEKPFDIEAFRDAWDSNFRIEVASGLLYALKNTEEISRKDKVLFLLEVLSRLATRGGEFHNIKGVCKDSEGELFSQALEYFFDLLPEWDANFSEMYTTCRIIIVDVLGRGALNKFGNRAELKQKFSSKIRKFLNSVLGKNKKENGLLKEDRLLWDYVAKALVCNDTFEELVSYNFTGIEVLKMLASRLGIAHGPGGREAPEIYGFNSADITSVLAENREPKVVSTFLRLLAKRSSNGNIFYENNSSAGTVYIHNGIIYTKLN